MKNFFSDDELFDILNELDELEEDGDLIVMKEDEEELEASKKRYMDIIKKHKMH